MNTEPAVVTGYISSRAAAIRMGEAMGSLVHTAKMIGLLRIAGVRRANIGGAYYWNEGEVDDIVLFFADRAGRRCATAPTEAPRRPS